MSEFRRLNSFPGTAVALLLYMHAYARAQPEVAVTTSGAVDTLRRSTWSTLPVGVDVIYPLPRPRVSSGGGLAVMLNRPTRYGR